MHKYSIYNYNKEFFRSVRLEKKKRGRNSFALQRKKRFSPFPANLQSVDFIYDTGLSNSNGARIHFALTCGARGW